MLFTSAMYECCGMAPLMKARLKLICDQLPKTKASQCILIFTHSQRKCGQLQQCSH